VQVNAEVKELSLSSKYVVLSDGQKLHYEKLISTLPLPELGRIAMDLPPSVREAVSRLDWFGVLLLNFGVKQTVPTPYQWVYFDQSDAVFHRIHYPSKLADYMAPSGHESIQAEISYSQHRRLPASEGALLELAYAQLKQLGFVSDEFGAETMFTKKIDYAYAIMNQARKSAVEHIRSFLREKGVLTCGRFGEWDYIWTDKVLHSGKKAGESLKV
jgi:UDP-galactopyranose mutase